MSPHVCWSPFNSEPGTIQKFTDIYHYADWAVDTAWLGHLMHKHGKMYFGVYAHYWSAELGWPDRPPILICSKCLVQIPDDIRDVLRAAQNLLNLGKTHGPRNLDK